MSTTKRKKMKRAAAHAARTAYGRRVNESLDTYSCKETAAYHSALVGGGSTIADTGLNAVHDALTGYAVHGVARRNAKRYGAALPLAAIATHTYNGFNTKQAIKRIHARIHRAWELECVGFDEDNLPSIAPIIERALSIPSDEWCLLIWRHAYHAARYQWLKSDKAKLDAMNGMRDAIRDLKSLNENSLTNFGLAVDRAINIA